MNSSSGRDKSQTVLFVKILAIAFLIECRGDFSKAGLLSITESDFNSNSSQGGNLDLRFISTLSSGSYVSDYASGLLRGERRHGDHGG